MPLDTDEDFDQAIARLAQRSPLALATFIGSLADDRGPVGEHVRAFILTESAPQAIDDLRTRISRLGDARSALSDCERGADIGARWGYILDNIETAVLPSAPAEAFDLLVMLIQCDHVALESSTENDYDLSLAIERAVTLLTVASRPLLTKNVLPVLRRLAGNDDYGCRQPVTALIDAMVADGAV